jgi:pimeloyl-ACP methyl ester carboxylesterase
MLFALSCVFSLPGCTTFQRTAHLYGNAAPPAHTFQYRDGGSSVYYTFTVGTAAQPDTLIFFYGATGCPSWKSVMPEYVDGLMVDARVFVLNKRFVPDRSTGMFGCSREFHLANNPDQWAADYANFIAAQLAGASPHAKNVVLVGVSEGALSAVKLAARLPQVTHLAIIGRRSPLERERRLPSPGVFRGTEPHPTGAAGKHAVAGRGGDIARRPRILLQSMNPLSPRGS